jgi:hypothetical protein
MPSAFLDFNRVNSIGESKFIPDIGLVVSIIGWRGISG